MAGEAFALFTAVLFLLAVQLPNLVMNGLTALDSLWQLIVPFTSYPVTVKEMLLAYTLLYLLSALLVGALVLCLSMLLKNTVAATGIIFAVTIADLFLSLAPKYRVLSQLRFLTPLQMLINSAVGDPRLTRLFGWAFINYQVAPVLYAILLVVFCLLAREGYRRHQIA